MNEDIFQRLRERVVAALRAADIQAEADREEAERREQLNRWYDQDRAAELDHGYDDGPSLGRDY